MKLNAQQRKARKRLRKDFGVRILDVFAAVANLKKLDLLDDCELSEVAELVVVCLADDNPKVAAAADFDWESLIELILKLLPLILALFGL